ncbi:MAG: DUF5018 domain-containing protein [Prevotellaceae bacterium]|jgi:hypothetical protein|nr:DUF5018 domain-containing protein [Prevotellaceae bacterium]
MKKLKFDLMKYLLILGLIMPVASCSEDDPEETPKRTEKEITAFSLPALELTGIIDPAAYTITLTVTPDFDQTLLESVAPRIEYKGEKIEPAATEPQNFTRDVTYKVTAEDGSSQDYTVSLTVSEFYATGFAKATEVWTQNWAALGFAASSEPTMAYLNGKLVASRSGIILDAATGEPTGTKLNVTGAEGKFNATESLNYPFSVTNDDAGNVIGVSLGAWTTSFLPVYKWTNSLESPPELVFELNNTTWAGGNLNRFGRKISVVGDINGNGYIAQYHQDQGGAGNGDEKQYIWKVTAGVVDPGTYTAIAARTGDKSYYQTLIPMTTASIYPYYLAVTGHSSGDPHSEISYKANESSEKEVINGFLENHFSSNWGSYVRHAKKFDFNGVTYLAILSVNSTEDYYLSIMDTRNNEVKEYFVIPKVVTNNNGSSSVTSAAEETLPTGEKKIRLYTLITDWGVYCHELTSKP